MDQQELQKNIALYYSKLPPEVQSIFAKMEWLENLKTLSASYNLNDEQVQELGTETTLVLLGIIHIEEYAQKLVALGLPTETTEKLLTEIDEKILKEVAPQLVETYNKNAEDLEKGDSQITESIDGRFAKLPEEVKKVIVDIGYNFKINSIAQEYKLNVPEMNTLEETTTKVITGAIHPDNFERELRTRLDLKEETARAMATAINAEILKPIRDKMEQVYTKPKTTLYDIKPQRKVENLSKATPQNTPAIKIVKPDLSLPELKEGDEKVDQKMTLIFAEKLSTPIKSTTVSTDHSLTNVTKQNNTPKIIYKVDPYRTNPNE